MLAAEWNALLRELGVGIRQLRHVLGWSQERVANRAITSQGSVSRLESGTCASVSLHSLVVVLRVLDDGISQLDGVILSPSLQVLLTFARGFDGAVLAPLDPHLVTLLSAYHQLAPAQQEAVARFVDATVARPAARVQQAGT